MLNIFKKKPKKDTKVRFFMILRDDEKGQAQFQSIVNTEEETTEYLKTLAYIENKDHFISWCAFQNLSVDNINSWEKYSDAYLIDAYYQQFSICEVYYTSSLLASLMRMLYDVQPVGCSFETKEEWEFYEENNIEEMTNSNNVSNNVSKKEN